MKYNPQRDERGRVVRAQRRFEKTGADELVVLTQQTRELCGQIRAAALEVRQEALASGPIEIEHLHSEPLEEVAYRGVGEGGIIAAPPAVVNAVADATGATVMHLPLTPERVLQLLDATVGIAE